MGQSLGLSAVGLARHHARGRGGHRAQLAGLGAEFIGPSTGAEVKPVAVITGLGGMGKTALVAEALALWETRFEWVLLYQAKPNALGFDAFLRDMDLKLRGELVLLCYVLTYPFGLACYPHAMEPKAMAAQPGSAC